MGYPDRMFTLARSKRPTGATFNVGKIVKSIAEIS
jgi:hypothetical protein